MVTQEFMDRVHRDIETHPTRVGNSKKAPGADGTAPRAAGPSATTRRASSVPQR